MPYRLGLGEMVDAVRRRELSPVELVEAHLGQIERHNPDLNAFVRVFAEQARSEARRLEKTAETGPLHGAPVTIKDSFDIGGLPTYCGSKLRLRHRATRDSTSVARLRQSGAVILGKTNCPEFLMNYETDNHVTGRTNNPWDVTRTPGGSSGGEAAAIAAFCSAGGIGSDGGGSIRFPAHCCGIAGLKPTPGRCPATGHFPEITHPGGLLGVGGPLARSAADVRLLFEVLAGHDPQDPFSAPVPLRPPDLSNITIGVSEQIGPIPVEAPLRDAVRTAASLFEQLGFPVREFRSNVPERAARLWGFFFKNLPVTIMKDVLRNPDNQLHWTGRELWDQVIDEPEPSGKDVIENLAARDQLRARMLREMETCPVLLCPAAGVTAFTHRQREWLTPAGPIGYDDAMAPLTPANCLGLPAVCIPVSLTPDGLPVGAQLVGRPYEEENLLELAVRFEDARGAFPTPPGY